MAVPVGGSPADRALLDPDGVFPERLAADRAALAALANGLWSALDRDERLRRMATLAHRLGGAAGTFGYHAVSESALALEDEILGHGSPRRRNAGGEPAMQRSLESLLAALDNAISGA